MIVKLLTEHHLEFLSLEVDCTGMSESTLVKMSNFWKSYAAACIRFPQLYGNATMFNMKTPFESIRLEA